MKVGELDARDVHRQMAGSGLAIRMSPVTLRVRSALHVLATQLHHLYRDYELADPTSYADIDVRMLQVREMRPWKSPQVQFVVDGTTPFDAFPLAHALPMLEWGLNWVFAHRMHNYLLLHAGVVARHGHALLLPAWPGSGKSTLAASLSCRGWRYLSDEFAVVRLSGIEVVPFVRPAALKNESIGVMGAYAPPDAIGTLFPNTRKGDVAHFRPPSASVEQCNEPATVAAIVFPDFVAGAPVSMRRLPKAAAFLKLAGNAFNYEIVGESGFRAVTAIVRRCDSWILRYGDLAEAHAALHEIAAGAVAN
jgi:HprK-related kinase A